MAIAYEEPSRLASFSGELKYANPCLRLIQWGRNGRLLLLSSSRFAPFASRNRAVCPMVSSLAKVGVEGSNPFARSNSSHSRKCERPLLGPL
jgi:hypothetical protein